MVENVVTTVLLVICLVSWFICVQISEKIDYLEHYYNHVIVKIPKKYDKIQQICGITAVVCLLMLILYKTFLNV